MLQYKINFDDIEWDSPIEGVRCKTYRYANKQMRFVEYTKEMTLHWCEKSHYGVILEGIFEIIYSNERLIYKEGDGVFIPGGPVHKHKGRAITESTKVLFVEDI